MKTRLTTSHILTLLEASDNYVIYCDYSRVVLVCAMMQQGRVISYDSRHLNVNEKNDLTYDLELAALIFIVKI